MTLSRNFASVAVLLALAFAAGCGGNPGGGGDKDKGTITGKATVKGAAPVAGTTIKFTGSDGKEATGAVDLDGSYTVMDVAPGEAKIVVIGGQAAKVVGTGGDMPGMSGNKGGATVPAKYGTPGAIPNLSVKKGENKHDIDLVP